MALAETAELAVNLALHGGSQYKAGITEAEAATAGLNKSVASTGNFMGTTASKMSLFKQATVSTGAAIKGMGEHLKGVLTGPLGLIGLGAGLFTVGGIIEGSVHKLEDFATGLEKVQALTGETVQQSSALILLFEKYGLGVDRVTQSVGFAEKTLGKLAETAAGKAHPGLSKLQVLDKQYGLQLVDTKGKVVDYSTELSQLADLYDRNIPASTKAYVASQVLGRSYAGLIPILKGGSAALREAAAAAAELDLDPGKVAAFREGMRNLGEQVNILQLRIGMALMPVLTDFVDLVNKWVKGGGSDQIVSFFKDGANAARNFGQVMGDSVIPTLKALGTTALAAWNTIPPFLRDWIVKGVVADRTIHFLFGVSPLHLAGSLIGDVAGPIIKTLIANRLIPQPVVIVGGGVPGLGGGSDLLGTVSKGGLLSTAAAFIGPAIGLAAGAIIAATVSGAIGRALNPGLVTPSNPTGQFGRPQDQTGPGRFRQFVNIGTAPNMRAAAILGTANVHDAETSAVVHQLTLSAKWMKEAAAEQKANVAKFRAAVDKHATAILKVSVQRDKETSGSIAGLIAAAAKRGGNILSAGAARDKETSDAINQINKLADSSDIERLQSKVAAGLTRDTSQVRASGAGIIGAIRASRPIVNVTASISATGVTHTTTVVRRAGPTGGTRLTDSTFGPGRP